jgi:hypothetical protein
MDADGLIRSARRIADQALKRLATDGISDEPLPLFQRHGTKTSRAKEVCLRRLPPEAEKLLLANSVSPLPLHKTLVLLEHVQRDRQRSYCDHELLALAKAVVFTASNLHFGPEVGLGPIKDDAPVVNAWLGHVETMARDIRELAGAADVPADVFHGDARRVAQVLPERSVDIVITSPPYPNEKDYTRTTRLESILLGLIHTKADLRELKKRLIRSNTRGVYRSDTDDRFVDANPEIHRLAGAIEARRRELGKTSGFERMYARVTKLYFGGMTRHLAELRRVLRPGAQLAYVVGDQASYLRVMIRTGQLLADIASALGYEVLGLDLFRTRLATATKEQLREEVVLLRWPGTGSASEEVSGSR